MLRPLSAIRLRFVPFLLAALALWLSFMPAAQAQFRVEMSGVGASQVPIAIAHFRDEDRYGQTLSRDGGSQLYLIGRNGDNVRRLTQSIGIDTEPVFSPDGRFVYFVSDRGGSPQIYRTAVSGGNAERITFAGSYNISPAISPDGRSLAYIARQGNVFRLHLQDLSGGAPQPLSDTSDDESPSFAPNGRLIIYASRAQGRDVLMTTTLDGKIRARLMSTTTDVREPVWGPFGR